MKDYIDLSVHQLVDFTLRTGDIDSRAFNSASLNEGTSIHKKYQKKQGKNYTSEVPLDYTFKYRNITFYLHGRCDGIIKDFNGITIDEIKSTNISIDKFYKQNKRWHLGQAICYAYIYCIKNDISSINISLTYISQINKQVEIKKFTFDLNELEKEVHSYLDIYIDFFALLDDIDLKKVVSLKNAAFPFQTYRKGQKELISFAKDILKKQEVGFIEAATGLGKTVSTIYSTFDEMSKQNIDKVFYLTAKNSGFFQANKTIELFQKNNVNIRAVNILAKEKMCLCEQQKCDPVNCPFARQYYDKLLSVLHRCLKEETLYSEEYLKKIAWEENVCPFELSLDLSLFSDYIVCDYNYVFHPIARLQRFFDSPDKQYKYVFLIDEAHNLVKRSRDMYSSSISFDGFLKFQKAFKKIEKRKMSKLLNEINKCFSQFLDFDFKNENGIQQNEVIVQNIDEAFIKYLYKLDDKYKDYCNKHTKFYSAICDEFAIELHKFLKIYALRNENYQIFIKKINEKDLSINLFCLDASPFIVEALSRSRGAVFFSGTLRPFDYYEKSILGFNVKNELVLSSPYDLNNFNLLINNNTSILYKDRKNTIDMVIEYIDEFTSKKIGNYMVFVPSFEYLSLIKSKIDFKKERNLLFQKSAMNIKEKEEFLSKFIANPKKTTIGFSVLGGSFSEGIDLSGDKLIGVVVIGIGLPQYCFENNLLQEYFDNKFHRGQEFAYVNPGINNVLQAVGRLIRSENDKGSALLIDTRYLYKSYKNLFKKEWEAYKLVFNSKDIANNLNNFYKN